MLRPLGECQKVGGQAPCVLAPAYVVAVLNFGYQRRNRSSRSLLSTFVLVCSKRWAPRSVHCICCFLTNRLLTTWLIVDSTNAVLLPHSPKRTQVRLKSLLCRVWLTPDPLRTHGLPSGQECRLRLKRPKSVFFNSFISSNLWKCDLEITQLYRTFLVTPGPSFLKPALKSTHNPG